jgi:membrane-associated protein
MWFFGASVARRDFLSQLLDVILHLDVHLNEWIRLLGPSIYVLLFAIIFCETGLVVTPFLPGDSLLFAIGALSAGPDAALDLSLLMVLLTLAGILGDAANYAMGRLVGPKVFRSETSLLFNRKHLVRTQEFYERYGGKTIIIARFIPIIRTFAPFVAGIGKMRYPRFALFNVIGGAAWVCLMLLAGYYFGNLPTVRKNFHLVILAIIFVSILPPVIEYYRANGRSAVRHDA